MAILRRKFLQKVAASTSFVLAGLRTSTASTRNDGEPPPPVAASSNGSTEGPDPVFEKPLPMTMAELAQSKIKSVAAVEVCDYSPGGFRGELSPSPPHADLNPKKAIIVRWENWSHRLVFCHEASYAPW